MNNVMKYVVGSSGSTKYVKIQEAINDAKKNGGGTVFVLEGIYEENLKFYDGVEVYGLVGSADAGTCVIKGQHTPPLSGTISIKNIYLISEVSIFFSKSEGIASIFLIGCFVAVKDGFIFDLPNWRVPGAFVIFDMGDVNSKDNGVVNNNYGASINFVAAKIGSGEKHSMAITGCTSFFTLECDCPIVISKQAKINMASNCYFRKTITINDKGSVTIMNSTFITENKPSFIYNSAYNSIISESSIDSTSDFAIEGVGKGALNIAGVSFINSKKIGKAVSLKSGDLFAGNFVSIQPGKGLKIAEGENGKMGIVELTNGRAYISNTSVTLNSRIFLTAQNASESTGALSISLILPGKGFEISSSNDFDHSKVAWFIVEAELF